MVRTLGVICLAVAASGSAAMALPIAGVSAVASSTYGWDDRAASHVVDGSGIAADGSASNSPVGTMWLSNGDGNAGGMADTDQSITFDLGSVYLVGAMTIWNYNEVNYTARGIASANVFVSRDNVTYSLARSISLAQAPGTTATDFSQSVTLNGFARYVRFGNITNFVGDDDTYTGLSEVQFMAGQAIAIAEPGSMLLLGMGVTGLLIGRRVRLD